jgi:hypothetical protein
MISYTQEELTNLATRFSCCLAKKTAAYANKLRYALTEDCGCEFCNLKTLQWYIELIKCYKPDQTIVLRPENGFYGLQINLPQGDWSNIGVLSGSANPGIISTFRFSKNGVSVNTNWTIYQIIQYLITEGFVGLEDIPQVGINAGGWEDDDYAETTQNMYVSVNDMNLTIPDPITEYPVEIITGKQWTGYSSTTPTTLYRAISNYSGETMYFYIGKVTFYDALSKDFTAEELNCISEQNLNDIIEWCKKFCTCDCGESQPLPVSTEVVWPTNESTICITTTEEGESPVKSTATAIVDVYSYTYDGDTYIISFNTTQNRWEIYQGSTLIAIKNGTSNVGSWIEQPGVTFTITSALGICT